MPGSDFSEAIKEQARKLAFFKCCYCRERQGDHVHHLVSKEDDGQGVIENAILLCAQCHTDYGHRRDKRTQLRQARDDWYEIVQKRYTAATLHQLEEFGALRNDVQEMKTEFRRLTETILSNFERGSTGTSDVVNIASTMISSIAAPSLPAPLPMSLGGQVPRVVIAPSSGTKNDE